ncbi:MAG: prenyltransferase [bacterium]|nr:prenyltransferase [bacterium]
MIGLALWRMARPLQLLSIFLVYTVGCLAACAAGAAFNAGAFAWGWAALVVLSVSIHYINEAADYETDALTVRTPFSGGSGVLPGGAITRSAAYQAAYIALGIGVGIALLGGLAGAIPPSALLILGIGTFGGWMYSAPPLKLAWRGWGELDNALLGGLLLPLCGFAMVTTVTVEAVCAFIPFTLLVFTNLLATTWSDRAADAQVGKYTLATFVPAGWLRRLYVVVLIAACVWFAACVGGAIPVSLAWMILPALPLMAWGAARYTRTESPHASVTLMVVFLVAQLVGWGAAALRVTG